jgi:hypothetical protein
MEWININAEGEVEFVSDEIKLVPEVQALLALKYNKGKGDADGRKKSRAMAELKYMRLAYSPRSPYSDYSEHERIEEAKKDCEFPEGWTESPEFAAALPKYLKGAPNKIERLLRTTEKFLDKFENHLNSLDLSEKKESGEYVNKPGDIIKTLQQLPALAQTLQELERQVRQGSVGVPKSRGDHETGWLDGSELDKDRNDDDRETSDN